MNPQVTSPNRGSRRFSSQLLATLADQVLVSATGFLSTLMVGRIAGPTELGLYSLGLSLSLLATSAQDALATSPLTVLGWELDANRKRILNGSVLVQSMLFGSLCAGICLLGASLALLFPLSGVGPGWVGMLAFLIPTTMLRQFTRKLAFIRHDAWHAASVDFAIFCIQIGMLVWLAERIDLTSSNAFLAVGVACGVGGVLGFLRQRHEFHFVRNFWRSDFAMMWHLGRWLLLSRWITVIHASAVLWWLAWMRGSDTAGVFAACISIVSVSNLITFAMANFLEPHYARIQANQGVEVLNVQVRRVNRAMFFTMTLVMGAIAIGGGSLAKWLYPDWNFIELKPLIAALSLAYFVDAIGLGTNQLLRVKRAMRASVFASSVGLLVTFCVAPLAIHWNGLVGGALALALGYAIANSLRYRIAFQRSSLGDVSLGEQGAS